MKKEENFYFFISLAFEKGIFNFSNDKSFTSVFSINLLIINL